MPATTTVRKVLESKVRKSSQSRLHFYSCAPGDAVDSVIGSVKLKRQTVGLPVIDRESERLVGFVTRQDLMADDREGGVIVQDVMTTSPLFVLDSESASHALEIMRQAEVRSLPVLDGKHGRCMGLITIDDVAATKSKAGGGGDDVTLLALQLDKDSVDM